MRLDHRSVPSGSDLLPSHLRRIVVEGDQVRDWAVSPEHAALFPYNQQIELCPEAEIFSWLWPVRVQLQNRNDFGNRTYAECGRPYWEYHQIPADRNRNPLSIAFAEVAWHNYFVLDRGGKVFSQSAPVIELPATASEVDYLTLLGLLNSSTI